MDRRPGVGTIIHVGGVDDIPCRAGIVTALEYGVGREEAIFVNVFTRNPVAPVVPATVHEDNRWHDLTDCPFEYQLVPDVGQPTLDREISRALGEA